MIQQAFDRGIELNPEPAAKNRAIFSVDCRFNQQLPRWSFNRDLSFTTAQSGSDSIPTFLLLTSWQRRFARTGSRFPCKFRRGKRGVVFGVNNSVPREDVDAKGLQISFSLDRGVSCFLIQSHQLIYSPFLYIMSPGLFFYSIDRALSISQDCEKYI